MKVIYFPDFDTFVFGGHTQAVVAAATSTDKAIQRIA